MKRTPLPKAKKRIPSKRAKPRVKRDRAPRPKPEAVKVLAGGREVCSKTVEGWAEYVRRRNTMRRRQKDCCAICGFRMSHVEAEFDHENGRGGGKRDDKIWTPEGLPLNAAVHRWCNSLRGSKRTPYQFQVTITREQWETLEVTENADE